MAKDYNIEEITTLAKKEMELDEMQPKVQYEIVVYDQAAEKPLRIIYLHDFLSDIEKIKTSGNIMYEIIATQGVNLLHLTGQ
ncbi:MAG: hypothetical protein U5L96_12080 [Owenweeksia sp.]|nr:hypothetical protein [Owenweeksia sp.]